MQFDNILGMQVQDIGGLQVVSFKHIMLYVCMYDCLRLYILAKTHDITRKFTEQRYKKVKFIANFYTGTNS